MSKKNAVDILAKVAEIPNESHVVVQGEEGHNLIVTYVTNAGDPYFEFKWANQSSILSEISDLNKAATELENYL